MNYFVTEKQKKILKVGVIWNAVAAMITGFFAPIIYYNNGSSASETLLYFLILVILILPVLAVNIYAYKKIVTEPSKSIVNLGFGFSIVSIFLLNPIGSIITIVAYTRIRKFNDESFKNTYTERSVEVEEIEEIDENPSNFFEL